MNQVGKYVVVREIGRGGMGVVYEARDPALDRSVALKLVNERADPERFMREARAAAKVIHPNCVPIFDIGEHEGSPFLVMELIAGVSATEFLERRGPLRWKTATRIILAACRGLAAVHDAGIVHRDIKPSNLLISKAGVVKVADFGLAKAVGKSISTLTGDQVLGTPHYMSPEQCWNETVDARSDIYALGATYFVLLTGRPPYHAEHELQIMFAHCNDPVPDARNVVPDIPAVCANVVRRAMAKSPADRYQSAREMLGALEVALTEARGENPSLRSSDVAANGKPDSPTMEAKEGTTVGRPPNSPGPISIVAPAAKTPHDRDEKTPETSKHAKTEPSKAEELKGTQKLEEGKKPEDAPQPADGQPTRRRWLLTAVPAALTAAGIGAYFAFRNHDTVEALDDKKIDAPKPPVLVAERKVGGPVGILGVAVSDDSRWLAVALNSPEPTNTGGVKLYDRSLGDVEEVWWRWREESCEGVAFSPDGKLLAIATSGDVRVRVWNMAQDRELTTPESKHGPIHGSVLSVAFSPDSKLLAAGVTRRSEDHLGFVRVWDVEKWTHLRDLRPSEPQAIRGVSFASDGKTLVAAMMMSMTSPQPLIEVWNATTGDSLVKPLKITQSLLGPGVAFARNEPLLAYSCLETVGTLRPRAFDRERERRFPTDNNEPAGLALSWDGSLLAYSISDEIYVWDTETDPTRHWMLGGQAGNIFALTFTVDGKTLISGSVRGTVHEWVIPPPKPGKDKAPLLPQHPSGVFPMPLPDDAPLSGIRLDQISTHLVTLQDAERFIVRYGNAIRGYLTAILRNAGDADEVLQEIIVGLLNRGGAHAVWPTPGGSGRFRDYLKAVARNAAMTFLRKKGRRTTSELSEDGHADPSSTDEAADREMTATWQRCVLDKVWRELDVHERKNPGNLCHTALKVYTEFPDAESPEQARIASERCGRTLTPEAFRKQVSRARRLMAERILLEVARSVVPPTAAAVEDELNELGLWSYVRDYLPEDWREQFFSG